MAQDPEQRLEAARSRISQLGGASSADWSAAFDELRAAEREAAAARGEQYAVPLDLGAEWDIGAPLPHLVAGGADAYIVCRAHVRDPHWDGSNTRMVSPADTEPTALMIIELRGCRDIRIGGPNDEARSGHPLSGRGLEVYGAFDVHNSEWIEQAIRINSVHPYHSDASFRKLRHYVLAFHDEMAEAMAVSILATVVEGSMRAVLATIVERMTSRYS